MRTWSRLAPVACLLAVALTACGKDPSATSIKIEAASVRIANPDGARHVLSIAPNGQVTLDTTDVFKLTGDGRAQVYPKLGFRLLKDDSVLINGQATNIAVRKNATFVMDGEDQLMFTRDGGIDGPLMRDIDHPMVKANATLTYTGSSDAKRATMLALAVVLTRGEQLPVPAAPPQ